MSYATHRGYSDDVPPAAALNTLVNDGDAVMVDIRTPKEKELSGVPDLPSAASSKVLHACLLNNLKCCVSQCEVALVLA